jgi:hypothetical protein
LGEVFSTTSLARKLHRGIALCKHSIFWGVDTGICRRARRRRFWEQPEYIGPMLEGIAGQGVPGNRRKLRKFTTSNLLREIRSGLGRGRHHTQLGDLARLCSSPAQLPFTDDSDHREVLGSGKLRPRRRTSGRLNGMKKRDQEG